MKQIRGIFAIIALLLSVASFACEQGDGKDESKDVVEPVMKELAAARVEKKAPAAQDSQKKNEPKNVDDLMDEERVELFPDVMARRVVCIDRKITDVWAAALNPKGIDSEGVDSFMRWPQQKSASIKGMPLPAATKDSTPTQHFLAHYTADAPIPVLWAMDWLYSVKTGSVEDPSVLVIDYKLDTSQARWTTMFIQRMEGQVTLKKISDNITEATVEYRDQRATGEAKKALETVGKMVDRLRKNVADLEQLKIKK